jgi:hypothetical protein
MAAIGAIATFCFSACPSPLSQSEERSSSGAAGLTIAFAVPSSRTVTASPGDFAAAIDSLAVAVVDGSSTTVASATGISYSAGVVKTFGSIAPGAYTVTVNAYNLASALIATGSAAVTIGASGNQNVTVDLAYGPNAVTGGFQLELSWPVATGLAYVHATVDGPGIADPIVTNDGVNYSATLTASDLSSGARILKMYFKTSAGAVAQIGPFVEIVNIWGGVTSTCWIDAGGNSVHTRSFAASDFSSSNADLAGLTFPQATLTPLFAAEITSYTLTGITGANISFTAEAVNGNQDVTYTWDAVGESWLSTGAATFASQDLALTSSAHTLKITVAATDKQTTRTYTITAPPVVTSATLATGIAANPGGSFTLVENATVTAAITAPFTGTLDGNGKTLTLEISTGSNNVGLFSTISESGTVKDLLVAGEVAGNTKVGAIAGINRGTITNCTTTAAVSGTSNVGGLVGENIGTISYSSSTGTVTGGTGINTGGIAGLSSGSLYRCYTAGTVSSTSGGELGGLVGWCASTSTIRECYSVATVRSDSGWGTGGLAGINSGTIQDSYARGAVTGPGSVAGISGDNRKTVAYCYATGSISGTPSGALVLTSYPALQIITDSYSSTSGDAYYLSTLGSAVPGTWSSSVWGRDAAINGGYPYLVWFKAGTLLP